jgi:hypothetical protein
MNPDSDIIGHLQFVKVAVTHDGGPSNIQQSGHLTTVSAAMLLVELRRNGYFIEKIDHGGAR